GATCGGLALALFSSPVLALGSIFVVAAATGEFLFPIRYRLGPEAAEMWNGLARRRIEWGEVRKAYLLEDGIKLSPLDFPPRLGGYRGIFLRFEDNREEVLAAVKRFRAEGQAARVDGEGAKEDGQTAEGQGAGLDR